MFGGLFRSFAAVFSGEAVARLQGRIAIAALRFFLLSTQT
jgi:hypothetical protein